MERANKQWSIFITLPGLTVERKLAGELPCDSGDYLYLKTTPEIFYLNDKIFGDWFLVDLNGVFLQKWNDTRDINCNLIFLDINSLSVIELKPNIPTKHWSTEKLNKDQVIFTFSVRGETVTYKVRREDLINSG